MPRSPLLATVVLALVFVAAKAAYLWPSHDQPFVVARLVLNSAEDVAVAMGVGLATAVAMRLSAKRPRLQRGVWTSFVLLGVLAVVYALLNVGIYRALRQPLNVRMLGLMKQVGNMWTSIRHHTEWRIVAGVLLLPAAFLLAARFGPRRVNRWAAFAVVILAVGWIGIGTMLRANEDPDGFYGRARVNPHREMARSLVVDLFLGGRVAIDDDFPAEYLDDFKLAAERSHPPLPRFTPPPKNVIVVVMESVGARYLSVYGSQYDTTPTLRAESKHAMVFDRFHAHVGYTFCSMMPIVYSTYPGLPWMYRPRGDRPMPTALPDLLRRRGYRTGYVTAADPNWGGMDYMARRAGVVDVIGPHELGGAMVTSFGTEDGVMVDGLIEWIGRDPTRPFYVLAWTDQTHDPYTVTGKTPLVDYFDETRSQKGALMERYLNAIRQTDHHLARLFAYLRRAGLADDTLVVITADHGEAFGDLHDVVGHGAALFDECLRVPFILWNPRLFPAGVRNDIAAGHVDLNPTLAHVLGIPPEKDWQGCSVFSPDHPRRAYLQADMAGHQFGLTDGRWKYILDASAGTERLYDLAADPLETRNAAKQQPDLLKQFKARTSAYLKAEERYLKGG